MSRIPPVDRNTTNDRVRKNFDAIQKQLGTVPNMMRTMAQSSSVLDAYLGFGAALRTGRLPVSLHEQIALAVAEINACDYCLSAHTALGRGAGLSNDELTASREARAVDPQAAAALTFAQAVVERRGDVRDQDLAVVRAAGYSDGDIAEIIAHVALNVFTNYFNRAAHTEIDFPLVTAGQLAQDPSMSRPGYDEGFISEAARVMEYREDYNLYRGDLELATEAARPGA